MSVRLVNCNSFIKYSPRLIMISKNLFSKQEYSRLPLSSRRARSNGTIRCNNCNGNTYNYSRHNETGRPQRFFSSSNSQGNDKSPINVARQHVSMKSFAIGSVAGVMGSLAGMGGGFVMIPLMTSKLLQLSQHTAHGTSLFAVAATGIAGALGYGLKDTVEVDSAAAVACCGMMTASLGARQTSRMSGVILRKALGVFMLCVAFVVPARGYIADRYGNPKSCNGEGAGIDEGTKNDDNPPTGGTLQSIFMQSKEQSELVYSQEESETIFQKAVRNASFQRLFPSAVIGLTSGFMAGMFGVGGGAVVVPALTIATDMTHYQALGTSLLAMAPTAVVGTFSHYRRGNVALRVAFPLSLGAFVGAYAGGKFGMTIPEDKLRWGFSSLMLTLGIRALTRKA